MGDLWGMAREWFFYLSLVALYACVFGTRHPFPILSIFVRWLRWALAALCIALCLDLIGWPDRGFPVLLVYGFALWFLLETGYQWLTIEILSRSPQPLFPRFEVVSESDPWPANPQLIALREWLRAQQFSRLQFLLSTLEGGAVLRTAFFQDPSGTIRLQIVFLPSRSGAPTLCFALSSWRASGQRVITDNLFLPFGGYYPADWIIERRPWSRSLGDLLGRHRERLDALGGEWETWVESPIDDINLQQRRLEVLNMEMGFLNPPSEQEEGGRISREGRYRVWKELWLLAYLGIPLLGRGRSD